MQTAPLSIPFAPPTGDSTEDLVLLEQEQWSSRTGLLTRAGMVRWLDAALYNQGSMAGVMDCGLTDGNLQILIHVYPLRPDVQFRLTTTAGQLGNAEYAELEESESVSFDMETTATLRHPALRIAAAQWLVGPYDPDGNPIDAPPLWIDGRRIIASRPMYGSVHLTTITPRYTYPLVLHWQEAQALLLAGWSEYAVCLPPPGRPAALALEAPPGLEDLAESGEGCGASRHYTHRHDGGPWPPAAQPQDKRIKCDYCELECDDERRRP